MRQNVPKILFYGSLFWAMLNPLNMAGDVPFADRSTLAAADLAPLQVEVVDLDGDGDGDLVTARRGEGGSGISQLLWSRNLGMDSQGKVAFDGAEVIAATPDISALSAFAVTDLDGDGDADVAAADSNDGRIVWYENLGGGNFGDPAANQQLVTTAAPGVPGVLALLAADLDRDGRPDLLAGGVSGMVWYRNQPSLSAAGGILWTEVEIAVATEPVAALGVADLDRDGDLDLVRSGEASPALTWYANIDGAGTFAAAVAISLRGDAGALASGDLNGDGLTDLVAAHCLEPALAWYAGRPDPGSGSFVETVFQDSGCADALFVADMDRDGDNDVAASGSNGVTWYENLDGGGTLGSPALLSGPAATALDLVIEDLDRDGDPDVIAGWADGEVAWSENRTVHRNAVFAAQQILDDSRQRGALASGDMDRDARHDLLDGSDASGEISLWRSNGDGTVVTPGETVDDSAGLVEQVLVADVDADGAPDVLAVAREPQLGVRWYANPGGQGVFSSPRDVSAGTGTPPAFEGAVAADLDQDGDLDVAALGDLSGQGTLRWYANTDGQGTFAFQAEVLRAFEATRALAAGDLDQDGDQDLIVGGGLEGAGLLSWLANDGTGVFTARAEAVAPALVLSLAVADMDGDGAADVVAGTATGVRWFRNSSGVLAEGAAVGTLAGRVDSVAAVDVDLDGDLDILAAAFDDDLLIWYENLGGDGRFTSGAVISDQVAGPRALLALDLDRDGDGDVVSASAVDFKLAWYENRGGQVGFGGTDIAPLRAYAGERVEMLQIRVTFHGRSGDSLAELATLALRLENSSGVALPAATAAALFSGLEVYRDLNQSGTVDDGSDVLVAQVPSSVFTDDVQLVALPDGDFNVRLGSPADFIVALLLSENAAGVASDFRLTHLADGDVNASVSTVEDFSLDLPLTLSLAQDLVSGVVTPVPVMAADTADDVIDESDEVTSLREAILQSAASVGDEVVLLAPGIYQLAIPGAEEDNGLTGDLDVNKSGGLLILQGAGAGLTFIDAGSLDRVMDIHPGARVEMRDLTLRSGAGVDGAGLRVASGAEAVLAGCRVSGNQGEAGAGIFNEGLLDMTDCAITGNAASGRGGGIASSGQLTLRRSLVQDNAAQLDAGISNDGLAQVSETTIIANQAALDGGGIANRGTLGLESVTLTGNSAAAAGGLSTGAAGVSSVGNSILAGNVPGDCFGPLDSQGFNLIQNTDDCDLGGDLAGNQIAVNPRLRPLQENGGPTLTASLFPDSPALDAGRCLDGSTDQRGSRRPLDLPMVTNEDNGCDIGAVETDLAQVVARINVPVRWCALEGSPSVTSQSEANAFLLQRTENSSTAAFEPQANLRIRSGATALMPNFPILEDLSRVSDANGAVLDNLGDVFIDPTARDFDEFLDLIARCREAWESADPSVVGITAVHINQFVGSDAAPLNIVGLGGRARPGDSVAQAIAGRVMVVDSIYREGGTPPDLLDRLLGHEMGHALGALAHGNGVDDDENGILDDDDDGRVDLPRFDGRNLMQYRNGSEMTTLQILQMRQHAQLTIPDLTVSTGVNADELPIDSDMLEVLDFGFLEILDFDMLDILDFDMLDVLDFEMDEVLDFDYLDILDFGVSYDILPAERPGNPWNRFPRSPRQQVSGSVSIFSAVAGLPWPSAVRTDTGYYYYLDLDLNDETGGLPVEFTDEQGALFPGGDQAVEDGVDLIARVIIGSETETLTVFTYREATESYVITPCDQCLPLVERIAVGLLQDTGGAEPAREEQDLGISVEAVMEPEVLLAAGWTISGSIGMEALTVADCDELVGDSVQVNCQCLECSECPDFPGCQENGEPDTIDPSGIVGDVVGGVINFTSPVLPDCQVEPARVFPGETVTIQASGFPATAGAAIQVTADGALLGSGLLDSAGEATVQAAVPLTAPAGSLALAVTLVEQANRALCSVEVGAPVTACARDVLPPVFITVPEPVTVDAADPSGTPVPLEPATARDICDPDPEIVDDAPALYLPGVTTVTYTATDISGNAATATTTVTVNEPGSGDPDLSLPLPDPLVVNCSQVKADGTGCAGADDALIASWLDSASASASDGTPLDVTHDAPDVFPAGLTMVTFTATSADGATVSGSAGVQVTYEFSGFLAPLARPGRSGDFRLRLGRSVPVKFRLACADTQVSGASAMVSLVAVDLGEAAPTSRRVMATDPVLSLTGTSGTAVAGRDGQFVYNLSTGGLDPGLYRIVVEVDDGSRYVREVILEGPPAGRSDQSRRGTRRPGRP